MPDPRPDSSPGSASPTSNWNGRRPASSPARAVLGTVETYDRYGPADMPYGNLSSSSRSRPATPTISRSPRHLRLRLLGGRQLVDRPDGLEGGDLRRHRRRGGACGAGRLQARGHRVRALPAGTACACRSGRGCSGAVSIRRCRPTRSTTATEPRRCARRRRGRRGPAPPPPIHGRRVLPEVNHDALGHATAVDTDPIPGNPTPSPTPTGTSPR